MPLDLCSTCQRITHWTPEKTFVSSQILSTNDVPSASDAVHIRQMLITRSEELAALDLQISDLQQARQHLQQDIIGCKTALSPARSLPTEVLSQILKLAPRKVENGIGVIVARESPLFLAHICRHWRSTAFSVPDIWSFIDVTLRSNSASHVQHRAEEFQLHLSLSKGASLSVTLVSRYHEVTQPFFRTLVSYFPRCQYLYIDLPELSFDDLYQSMESRSCFPGLRDITFHKHVKDPIWRKFRGQTFRALSEARALRRASIQGSCREALRLSLPWYQLTYLDISSEVEDTLAVLSRARNITECHFYCMGTQVMSEDFDDDDNSLELPNLRSLHLAGNASALVVLRTINTPALENFSCQLQPRGVLDISVEDAFFFLRYTSVEKITTHERWFYCMQLSPMRNLRELHISDWSSPVEPFRFRFLTHGDEYADSPLAIPQLETLIISSCKGDPNLEFHDDRLFDVIASRRTDEHSTGVAQIKSVTLIDISAHMSNESRQRLEEMQKGGLEVVFLESASADLEAPWVWNGSAHGSRRQEYVY